MAELRKFRKRPVVIEAVRWFKNGDHPGDGPSDKEGQVVRYYRHPLEYGDDLCDRQYQSSGRCTAIMRSHGWIDTLDGGHIVCPGDWIITGIKGENYPCKPDVFEATYEQLLSGSLLSE